MHLLDSHILLVDVSCWLEDDGESKSAASLTIRKDFNITPHFLAQTLTNAQSQPIALRVQVCVLSNLAEGLEDLSLVFRTDTWPLIPDL